MPMTLDEIRTAGLEALRQRLGRAGMIRFLQQFETGSGDYTAQRRQWVDQQSLAALRATAKKKSKRRPRSNKSD